MIEFKNNKIPHILKAAVEFSMEYTLTLHSAHIMPIAFDDITKAKVRITFYKRNAEEEEKNYMKMKRTTMSYSFHHVNNILYSFHVLCVFDITVLTYIKMRIQ